MDALKDVAVICDLPVTEVGTFAEGPPKVSLRTGNVEEPLEPASFDHFQVAGGQS
jgi:hypothetical protein